MTKREQREAAAILERLAVVVAEGGITGGQARSWGLG